jgi:hypothetical protein
MATPEADAAQALAEEMQRRGHSAHISKHATGTMCEIATNDDPTIHVAVSFGYNPLGGTAIEWQVDQNPPKPIPGPIESPELADRIIEAIGRTP